LIRRQTKTLKLTTHNKYVLHTESSEKKEAEAEAEAEEEPNTPRTS